MSWMDIGLGNCVACGDERRRYVKVDGAHGSSAIAVCCPCTLRAARNMPSKDDEPDHEETSEERWARWRTERYARRIVAGLCRDCGKEPAQPGNQRGVKCSDKHKARETARRVS